MKPISSYSLCQTQLCCWWGVRQFFFFLSHSSFSKYQYLWKAVVAGITSTDRRQQKVTPSSVSTKHFPYKFVHSSEKHKRQHYIKIPGCTIISETIYNRKTDNSIFYHASHVLSFLVGLSDTYLHE